MDTVGATPEVEWYAIVADDDDDSRALLAGTLRRAHLQVCEACDGEELLERYEVLSVLVGRRLLVVSDIGMPIRDGIAATRELRHRSSQLPIMLITAFRDERITEAAHAAGANLVLSKPLSASSLLDALGSVLPPRLS
jgi:two-component system OmpR family response regulator